MILCVSSLFSNLFYLQPPTPPIASVLPLVTPAMPNWVVTAEERSKFDVLFRQTDIDKDGFVSGAEIRDVFLRYNVPQPVLAHIWYNLVYL